jgi:hypothetical protein
VTSTVTTNERQPAPAIRVGRLVPGSEPGGLLVDFDGNGAGPLAARSTLTLDEPTIAQAVATGRGVLLVFEDRAAASPVVVGLLEASPGAALLGELLVKKEGDPPARARQGTVEAQDDGRRLVIKGREEVVLVCGDASITLRRDGKVVIRGAHVETDATGVNRIKGGAVKIN